MIPALHGRQVITFDFLGWGASEKPTDHAYTSKQQEGELHAVLDALHIDQVVPVAHDASGPVAINWALDHPERVSSPGRDVSLVMMSSYSNPSCRLSGRSLLARQALSPRSSV